jgi:ERCC4-related helicase
MSNEMLEFAQEIREAAKELEMEAKKKKIYIGDEDEDSPELSEYRQHLKGFIQNHKDLVPYLDFFKILMNVNLLNKQGIVRNSLVNVLQKRIDEIRDEAKDEKGDMKSKHIDLPNQIVDFMRKFDKKEGFKNLKKHPAYKLLKEILNYLIVRGTTQFGRLFVQPGNFHNTFLTQKEKQQLRREEKEKEE